MPLETFWIRGPVVRDGLQKLWQWTTIGTSRELVSFEQRLLWIRQTETHVVLRHRGVPINSVVTLCDYYGFLTSVTAAIEEVHKASKRMKCRRGDALSVDLDVTVFETPVMVDEAADAIAHNAKWERKQYRSPPREWFLSDERNEEGFLKTPMMRTLLSCHRRLYSSQTRDRAPMEAFLASQRARVSEGAVNA